MKRLTLILCLLLIGPAQADQQRSLTIGIAQFPASMHPLMDILSVREYITGFVARPMTAFDADWQLVCLLCEEMPSRANGLIEDIELEDGRKALAVTYRLRDEHVWGDGTPVTAADAVLAWRIGAHPGAGAANHDFFSGDIIRVEPGEDAKTIRVIRPRICDAAELNSFSLVPAHLEAELFEADPESYAVRTLFDAETTRPGLYHGPYVIADYVSGSHVTLTRNAYWAGPDPAFDTITIRTIENSAALESNLMAGDIDMIPGEIGITPDQAVAMERRAADRFQFVYQPGLVHQQIALNLENPILADPRIRRAMLQAVDRKALADAVFAGKAQVAHVNKPPADPVFYDGVPRVAYDPDAAAEALDAAGWRMGRGGIRRNAAGEPMQLELLGPAGNRTLALTKQVLREYWRQVGIDVRINSQPARLLFGQTMRRRQFPGMILFSFTAMPGSIPTAGFHSAYIPTEANNWTGQNFAGLSLPEVDRVLDGLETECDPETRQSLWAEFLTIYANELFILPLLFRDDAHVLPLWLDGLRPTGHDSDSSMWVEYWTVEEG